MERLKEGAPIKMKSGDRGYSVSFYVDPEQKKILEDIRWREHKTFSEIVRKAVDEYISKHADGNDTFKLDKWSENPDFQITPAFDSASLTWSAFLKDCNKQELVDKSIKAKEILDKCHYFYKQK